MSHVQRRYFNEGQGAVILKDLVVPDLVPTIELESKSKSVYPILFFYFVDSSVLVQFQP